MFHSLCLSPDGWLAVLSREWKLGGWGYSDQIFWWTLCKSNFLKFFLILQNMAYSLNSIYCYVTNTFILRVWCWLYVRICCEHVLELCSEIAEFRLMFVFQLGHMEQQLEELLGAIMSTCRYVVVHLIKLVINLG